MGKGKYAKKSQLSFHEIMYRTVGIIFVLTMLSIWLLSGLFAKYVISDNHYDSARVAKGMTVIEVKEHQAELKNGEYELDEDTEVTGNDYSKVIPGVDIPKDPFIELNTQNAEVSYELYVKVTEIDLPDTVTYQLTSDWDKVTELSDASKGIYVYKYKKSIDPNFNSTIKILKNNKLYVSEHYVGNNQKFSLTFSAYLKQVKTN